MNHMHQFENNNKGLFLLLVTFFMFTASFAQDRVDLVETQNARESLQIAQTFVNRGHFKQARKQLEYTIKLKDDFAVAYRELGRVLMELDQFLEAAEAFEASFDLDGKLSRAAYFECGESYFQAGTISQALYYFETYEKMKEERYTNKKKESGLEKDYDRFLEIRKENCRFILENIEKGTTSALPENIGGAVNSQHNDYLPTIETLTGKLVFTRDRRGQNENILTATKDDQGEWSKVRSFDGKVNTRENEGMARYATSGRSFFFAGSKRPDSEGGCDLYQAKVDWVGDVEEIIHLEGLNSDHWDSQPCVSCQGDVIYFSSSREGGLGGADIYKSYKLEDGTWAAPENLGPSINTPFDEEAPYIASDKKTLYFTSNGHGGQGDGDLFISRFKNEEWTPAENLGYPMNSQAKELGIHIMADGKTAYFASARFGGYGGLDIYKFELPKEYRPSKVVYIDGVVIDDSTNRPLPSEFKIYRTGEKYEITTDAQGRFFTCLNANKAYTFHVEIDGYEDFMSAIFIPEATTEEPTAAIIQMIPIKDKIAQAPEPKVVKEHKFLEPSERTMNLYFDINSSDLDRVARMKLEDLSQMLVKSNEWEVEVVGYADSSGNADYNKMLSDKRAQAVANHLKSLGVDIKDVRQEGRGAQGGTTEEERRLSRRVEVIIQKIDKDPWGKKSNG